MRGLSCWSEKGGKLSQPPTLLYDRHPVGEGAMAIFSRYLYRPGSEYVLVGDESVVTKAGKTTYCRVLFLIDFRQTRAWLSLLYLSNT